jgi:hypothetical protein
MPERTSKVNFFETSSGLLHEGDGQISGYPAPLNRNRNNNFKMFLVYNAIVSRNNNLKDSTFLW